MTNIIGGLNLKHFYQKWIQTYIYDKCMLYYIQVQRFTMPKVEGIIYMYVYSTFWHIFQLDTCIQLLYNKYFLYILSIYMFTFYEILMKMEIYEKQKYKCLQNHGNRIDILSQAGSIILYTCDKLSEIQTGIRTSWSFKIFWSSKVN